MVDLQKVANELKKTYSSADIAENIPDPKDFISTGNLTFDLISDGGIPFGYLVEFLGLSKSGKSYFIQQIIANAQKKYNATGILVDRENAFFKGRGIELGIDVSKLLLAKPKDVPLVSTAFQFILDSVNSIRKQDTEEYIVVGLDSISAFGKDVTLDKADPGRKAKAAHEGLRAMLDILDERVAFVVANQVTFKVNVLFGNKKTTTAGESMRYYSTVRFALEDKRKIIDPNKNNEVVGSWIGIEVVKTRLGPCYRTCHIPFFYKGGIPYYGGYARLLVDRGYVKPNDKKEFTAFKQNTIKFQKEKIDEFEIESFLENHPELLFEEYPEFNMVE